MIMKKLIITLIAALGFIATAQYVDTEVERTVDEFSGNITCSQGVIDHDHPHALTVGLYNVINESRAGIIIVLVDLDDPLYPDEIILRFPSTGDVLRFQVDDSENELSSNDWTLTVSGTIDLDLARRLVTSAEDIPFRLYDGGDESYDDILDMSMLRQMNEFRDQCL